MLAVLAIVYWATRSPLAESGDKTPRQVNEHLGETLNDIDARFQHRWDAATMGGEPAPISPAEPANDLTILRRLSLTLHGTVPSLEEIRQFEADQKPKRLRRWTLRFLRDRRFADYFAERLARSYVGTEGGTFLVYRRDRFVQWLAAQLRRNRRYDALVRDIIAADGLWTGTPAANFMTSAFQDGRFDVNKLTGRTVRAFLGQRLDCAQCHDHPFDERWKQHHFEGLAAFFAQAQLSVFGVEDKPQKDDHPVEYVVEDRLTQTERTVAPAVPFGDEWLAAAGSRRERLAAWITHEENVRFARAAVNRVWALLFGRAYTYPYYAVDDLPDPDDPYALCDMTPLDRLADDFRKNGYDLRRLILLITSTRVFRSDSVLPFDTQAAQVEDSATIENRIEQYERHWAVFPLTQLRPEQVIGSMIQTASLKTIDRNSNVFIRFVRFIREKEFVEEYGDPGAEELTLSARTIPQSLLLMNGKLTHETSRATPFTASGRILRLSGSDRHAIETCYLTALTRRPTNAEMQHWEKRLREAETEAARQAVFEDLYWTMFNSPEFSWNH